MTLQRGEQLKRKDDLKNAAKRFWRQGLFSKVQIKVEKVYGDKVWLEFCLQQQPH